MDLLGSLLTGTLSASTPGPTDDFWYGPVDGGITPSGLRVDADGAQKLSAWYRGRSILATVLAMLPFPVYQRLANDGGSEPATDHPLYDLLHDQPNDLQDSFQWRRQGMCDLIDRGNFYNWIVPGQRGFADQLVRIDPTLVTPKLTMVTLPNGGKATGRMLYDIRDDKTGQAKTFTADDIFHLRGADGKGILEYARTSIGTALATESYAAQIFGRGPMNGGVIEVPGPVKDEAAKALARSFLTNPGDWHVPKLLPLGAKWNQNTLTPEDAQMLLSRKFTVDDIARWLGVPRQMLENNDPSFGNAEQFDDSFITYSMGGWLSLFEFGVNHQLILNPKKYFAEFTRNAIVRGKFAERIAGLVLAAGGPIMTRNEARKVENYNAIDEPAYDKLLEQANITGKPSATPNPTAPTVAKPKQLGGGSKAEAIAVESASRLLLKEVAEVQKLAVKHAGDGDAFAVAVTNFYAAHVARVEQWLQMPTADAERYCAGQAGQVVVGDWLAALELWKTSAYASGLAALALEDAA
jgi:HK97 family phage portal protein